MNTRETKTFLELLSEMPEHRKGNAIRHKLGDILTIGILCILCNGETFTGMELFGETHEEELRKYLELPYGIPSHDVFGSVFSRLDTSALEKCFQCWLGAFREEVVNPTISIDGKTSRGSKTALQRAKHIVTAYSSDLQLVLGQETVEEKSNEITAIPLLLEALNLSGCTVTIDAMGTQTEIAQKIIEKGGDYILALKGNHPSMQEDIRFYFEQEILPQPKQTLKAKEQYANTLEKGHGRIEGRACYLLNDLSWLEDKVHWAGLHGAALIRTRREVIGQEASVTDRLYLYSNPDMTAKRVLQIQRSHWAIENQLHWMLDVCFHEDNARARTGNAAIALNILRKCALHLLKGDSSVKGSVTSKRLRCAWDFQFALNIISSA